jgi:hypothetical protein
MRWMIRNLALPVVTILTIQAQIAQAQDRQGARQTSADSPFITTNRILQASLNRIAEGSALWRTALNAVRTTGRHALVVTPDEAIVSDQRKRSSIDGFDPDGLAEVMTVVGADSQVAVVLVVVNLPLIQGAHDARRSLPREFEADLDRVIVHEIYGHAVPYLVSGTLSGRCADPREGERASHACSIRRENAVRAELGLGHRIDPGLSSLSLAWGRSF